MRLVQWLQEKEGEITRRWLQELRRGRGKEAREGVEVLHVLAAYLVAFLSSCFGPHRETGREIWQHVSYLYGSLAVRRGLAAGEVVEEMQLLRGILLRLFLAELASSGETRPPAPSPREFLALNEVMDLGVSRASIAYVDDLFFTHIQGSGVPPEVDEEITEEIRRQLEGFCQDLGREPLARGPG